MAFKIGQKVECVDAANNCHLSVGGVYTVTCVVPCEYVASGPECRGNRTSDGLYLAETATKSGFGFYATRFRPIIEKQTDITVFTEILNREKKNSRVLVSDHQS